MQLEYTIAHSNGCFVCCRVGSYTIETNYAMLSIECVVLQLSNRFSSTAFLEINFDICLENVQLLNACLTQYTANLKFPSDASMWNLRRF